MSVCVCDVCGTSHMCARTQSTFVTATNEGTNFSSLRYPVHFLTTVLRFGCENFAPSPVVPTAAPSVSSAQIAVQSAVRLTGSGLTANQFNQPDMKTKFKNSIESVLQDVTVTNIVATDVVTRRRRLQTVTGIDVSFTLVRKVKSRKQQFQSQEAKRRTPISIHNHALLFQIDPGVDDPEVVFEALAQ